MSARHSGSGPSIRFDLPSEPGTYILILKLHWECVIDVGALGELTFSPGFWLYCGSALGPGGLAARIAHHARFAERPRWHVDYLRFAGTPVEVWYALSDESIECVWASLLSSIDGVEEGARGFGSSDCGCAAHLFHADSMDTFERFRDLAGDVQRAAAVRLSG
jgi:Uri superfamily endonuclease